MVIFNSYVKLPESTIKFRGSYYFQTNPQMFGRCECRCNFGHHDILNLNEYFGHLPLHLQPGTCSQYLGFMNGYAVVNNSKW